MLVRKFFAEIETKALDDVSELYQGVATTENMDRLGERVDFNGLELDGYMRNPILLFNHDKDTPIGAVKEVRREGDKLIVVFKFASTPKAQEVKTLVDEGVLRALSIGFISKQQRREGNILVHSKWELLEVSIVTIPANPEALIVTEFPIVEPEPKEIVTKGTTPFADLPLDMEREWDKDESEARYREWAGIETNEDLQDDEKRRKYRMRFFWWDGEGTTFGGYKLPFVDIVDGRPKAIWHGVVAAMASLLGARGGVDIPDEDKEEVYNHIVKYYEKADKEPPEFHKMQEFISAVRQFLDTIRAK